MSSALPLIVLGQLYLLVPAPNSSAIGTNLTNSSFFQLSGPMQEAIRHKGYTYIAGIGAYRLHVQAETWNTARLICREEGAELAIMNSRTESEAIAGIFADGGPHLDSFNTEFAWLGFHDLFGQQGRFETLHGEYLENAGFNEWKGNGRSGYGAFCGDMYKDGKLNYCACHRKLAFVCELPHIQTYIDQSNSPAISAA